MLRAILEYYRMLKIKVKFLHGIQVNHEKQTFKPVRIKVVEFDA